MCGSVLGCSAAAIGLAARKTGDNCKEAAMPTNRHTSRPALSGPGGTAYLTPRQAQVLELAARGLNDKEIATYLGISRRTVRDRFNEMRERTGTRTRAELIARAAEAGLVRSAPDVSPADPTAGTGQSGVSAQRHDAAIQTILNTSFRQDVTVIPLHPKDFVNNGTLRMCDTDMTNPSGDRGKPRTLLPRSAERDSTTMDQALVWRGYPVRDEPSVSAQDVLDALYQVKAGRDRLDHTERALIDIARRRGVTWLNISRALGVGTAQAAQQRRKRLGDPAGADDLPDPSPQA
jgi:DNA-binding CsgD family transcriptional regulator